MQCWKFPVGKNNVVTIVLRHAMLEVSCGKEQCS